MANAPRQRRDYSRIKLSFVAGVFALVFAALWVRAGYLQLYRGPQLEALADRQSLAAEYEHGQRGRILTRTGDVLAASVEAQSVYARPLDITDPATAKTLAQALEAPEPEIRKLLSQKKNFVWVRRQVSDRQAQAVAAAKLPGIHLATEYNRLYPAGHMAGQVLGFVDVDGVGREGVELFMQDRLKPGQAKYVVQRDAAGRRLYLDEQGAEMDIDGRDVRLTIDGHIQDLTEQSLAEAVRKHGAQGGMALVVHVPTGEILAMANYPFFNPNLSRSARPELRKNRAALDVYEPGSTMKAFVVAAALEQKAVTPEKLVDCENGRWNVRSKTIRDDHPHKWLTVNQVIRYSSNIGAAKIGQSIGAQAYYDALVKLGFGSRTSLDLPSESQGILHPAQVWKDIDLAVISFGQGVGVTALQMAKAYMCIANFGELKPLRLIAEPATETPAPVRVFSEKTAKAMLSMLREVVEMDGTGKLARIPGVPMAGKTGTAQKPSKTGGYSDDRLSSFVGLVPADKPEYLILTMVDDPSSGVNYGGIVAAPVVREVAVKTLAYYGKLPENPVAATAQAEPAAAGHAKAEALHPEPSQVTAQAAPYPGETGEMVPNVSGLPVRRAVEMLVRKGYTPVLKGRGTMVTGQKPAAGEPWPQDKGENDAVFVLWLS